MVIFLVKVLMIYRVRSDSEEVYSLVEEMQNNSDFEKRILAYAEKLRAL